MTQVLSRQKWLVTVNVVTVGAQWGVCLPQMYWKNEDGQDCEIDQKSDLAHRRCAHHYGDVSVKKTDDGQCHVRRHACVHDSTQL